MNDRLQEYARALSTGLRESTQTQGLCGRIIRGKEPEDFRTLTDNHRRQLVLLMGPDGLESLIGKTGFEMLIEIGYTEEHIRRKVIDEGNSFKLVVFPEGGPAKLATWDNVLDMATEAYPDVACKLNNRREEMKQVPFSAIELAAGYRFADSDRIGEADSRYMSFERLKNCSGTLVEVRAFLYHTLHLGELFSGDGYTYTKDGRRGLMEYLVPNRPIASLGEHLLIDLEVHLPVSQKS
jgi:hypothetical protein